MLNRLFGRRRKGADRKQTNLLLRQNVQIRLKMLSVAMGIPMYELADYFLDDGMSRIEDPESLRKRLGRAGGGGDGDTGR